MAMAVRKNGCAPNLMSKKKKRSGAKAPLRFFFHLTSKVSTFDLVSILYTITGSIASTFTFACSSSINE